MRIYHYHNRNLHVFYAPDGIHIETSTGGAVIRVPDLDQLVEMLIRVSNDLAGYDTVERLERPVERPEK
jgi:hypothetical protein